MVVRLYFFALGTLLLFGLGCGARESVSDETQNETVRLVSEAYVQAKLSEALSHMINEAIEEMPKIMSDAGLSMEDDDCELLNHASEMTPPDSEVKVVEMFVVRAASDVRGASSGMLDFGSVHIKVRTVPSALPQSVASITTFDAKGTVQACEVIVRDSQHWARMKPSTEFIPDLEGK